MNGDDALDIVPSADNEKKLGIVPAYEIVKREILFNWFRIQSEYRQYIRVVLSGKIARIDDVACNILSLYRCDLRPKLAKVKKWEEFIVEMDKYFKENQIPPDKLNHVVDQFASFLEEIGLTNINFEMREWEDDFARSYK